MSQPFDSCTVAIVDYGLGNLFSVKRACELVGLSALITSEKDTIENADGVVLPGVGAFGDAMVNLRRLDLIEPLKDFIKQNRPFMGICLGFQLLMSESTEFGVHKGLNIFEGSVERFFARNDTGKNYKVPHVGWNRIRSFDNEKDNSCWDTSLLKGVSEGEFMYFVHSFYVEPRQSDIIISTSEYEGFCYCSSVSRGNIFACQFHPEKSASAGLLLYKNFANAIRKHRAG